jgi:peptidoglycan hydrolase CwlO-like protein
MESNVNNLANLTGNTSVPTQQVSTANSPTIADGLFQPIIKKLTENKLYLYIGIAVIVLGLVLYYLYYRNKNETSKPPANMHVTFNPATQDYYVVDANGVPVKVHAQPSELAPIPITQQQPSAKEVHMLRKLQHPNENEKDDANGKCDEVQVDLEDIDVEISRIHENEDKNIAEHNLTNSELAEINRKIDQMANQDTE